MISIINVSKDESMIAVNVVFAWAECKKNCVILDDVVGDLPESYCANSVRQISETCDLIEYWYSIKAGLGIYAFF
jgi:hypothetical protein